MLYINTTRPSQGRVNLKELAEVRQHYMPAQAVRFALPCQLERVATEVARQRPELREETTFVVHEELTRRRRLAEASMRVLEGGLRHE